MTAAAYSNVSISVLWPEDVEARGKSGERLSAVQSRRDISPGNPFILEGRVVHGPPGESRVQATAEAIGAGFHYWDTDWLVVRQEPQVVLLSVEETYPGSRSDIPLGPTEGIIGEAGDLPPGWMIPSPDEGEQSSEPSMAGASANTFSVKGQAIFSSVGAGQWLGIHYALVEVWDHDDWTSDDLIGGACTDGNGNFQIGNIDNNDPEEGTQDVYLVFKTGCANRVKTYWEQATCCGIDQFELSFSSQDRHANDCIWSIKYNVQSGTLVDFGQCGAPSALEHSWQVHDYAEMGADLAINNGFNPGIVKLVAPAAHAGAHYHEGSNEIHIPNPIFDYANEGEDVVTHEYAHFIFDKVYNDNPPANACPSPHFLDADSNQQCAWTEGWATHFGLHAFVGASRYADNSGTYNAPGFTWNAEASPTLAGHGGDDSEGDVVGSLWDVIDASGFFPEFRDNIGSD